MLLESDIFVELNKEEIVELKKTYEGIPYEFHVYTFLGVCEKWYEKGGITVTSPGTAWKENGSFVSFLDLDNLCCIFPYSLDKNWEQITEGFLKTNRLDPKKPLMFVNILEIFSDNVLSILKKINWDVIENKENNFYTMSIEKAKSLTVECPPETYIKKLTEQHAKQVNNVWPHRFENSDRVVADWLTKNDGYGLFLRENHELVSWALQGFLGHLSLLQTEQEYMGRGYGKVLVKYMAKKIAESGYLPAATVLTKNAASNSLFTKIGFESKTKSYFISAQHQQNITNNEVYNKYE